MALTVSDDSVILDSGIRLKFLRDAEYDPAPPLVAIFNDQQTLLQCTSDGRLKIDASVTIDTVDIGDVDVRGKDAGGVSRYLQVLTEPVTSRYALIVSSPSTDLLLENLTTVVHGGTPFAEHHSAPLGGGASANHDYTNATGSLLHLDSIVCASTTPASYKVFIDPTGTGFESSPRWVAFTSEHSPSFVIDLSQYHLAAGGKVRVTKTNRALAATAYEVYDTINAENY